MVALDGKVAIVTGAGRGIGRAEAAALAAAGATVVVNDLGDAAATVVEEILAAGGQAVAATTDVTRFHDVAALVGRTVGVLGRLDIVVNNAGILRDRMLAQMTEEEFDAVIAVHLKGHFNLTRHALAHWRAANSAGEDVDARVINTSSPSGLLGNAGQANYAAAKAGIAALTQVASLEGQRYGVTVNGLCPTARTRLTETLLGDGGAPQGGWDPFGPGNVAPLVVALCAPEAAGITGQVFGVVGGLVQRYVGWQLGPALRRDEPGPFDPEVLLERLPTLFEGGATEWASPMPQLLSTIDAATQHWANATARVQ